MKKADGDITNAALWVYTKNSGFQDGTWLGIAQQLSQLSQTIRGGVQYGAGKRVQMAPNGIVLVLFCLTLLREDVCA